MIVSLRILICSFGMVIYWQTSIISWILYGLSAKTHRPFCTVLIIIGMILKNKWFLCTFPHWIHQYGPHGRNDRKASYMHFFLSFYRIATLDQRVHVLASAILAIPCWQVCQEVFLSSCGIIHRHRILCIDSTCMISQSSGHISGYYHPTPLFLKGNKGIKLLMAWCEKLKNKLLLAIIIDDVQLFRMYINESRMIRKLFGEFRFLIP